MIITASREVYLILMDNKAVRYVLLGQVSLFGFLFVCLMLIPHFLLESNEGGVSNYGLYAKTIVPYTLAFGLCGLLTLLAMRFIPHEISHYKALKMALASLGVLLIAVLLSTYPYKVNDTLNAVHVYVGTALAFLELGLGTWFTLVLARDAKNIAFLALQVIGFVLGILTHFGVIHILFVTELLTSLAFGVILVRTVDRLTLGGSE
jgi:hypothetical protein